MALVPLALHGGPLWEQLRHAQIAGLTVATVVTFLLVPVVYSIFGLDLMWAKWDQPHSAAFEDRSNQLPFGPFG